MPYLLNAFYILLLVLCSPWLLLSAWRKGKYRAGWAQKFLGHAPIRPGLEPCLWLHAVSLGEVSLIAPLVAEMELRHPEWRIAISTTTRTGYVLAMKRYPEHLVFYCPLDFTWAVRNAIDRIRPAMLLLVELELWPNLIAAARAYGARVAVINGRLSERSFRGYRRVRPLLRRTMARLDLVAAQNTDYADRFLKLGARPAAMEVTGSLKFDGATTDRQNPATLRLRKLAGFAAEDIIFLAGSTQEPEEHLALETFRALADRYPRLKLVIVPRHPDRFQDVAELLTASHVSWQRRSTLDDAMLSALTSVAGVYDTGAPSNPVSTPARILLVDTVGELGAWWGTATIAYVGGSMGPRNGQNMIEPAAYGAAVSFGPRTRNFRDVVETLLDADAAVVVYNGPALTAFVEQCLADPLHAHDLGLRAQAVVASQQGATRRTADLLDALLDRNSLPARRSAA